MAYVNQTNRGFAVTSTIGAMLASVGAGARNLMDAWRQAQVFRDTYARLDGLSTRQLEDMGLSRHMITRAAYEAAYGSDKT